MFRRDFIQRLTLAGSLATAGSVSAAGGRSVTFTVEGFTCVTCAVGLDTMLSRQKGVVRSKSSYKDATSTIEFDPNAVTVASLKAFIGEMGFIASEVRTPQGHS